MDNCRDYFKVHGHEDSDYSNKHLTDVGGKGLHFKKCNFNYAVLERAYFHQARFENCTFVGTRFLSCNFRSAVLSQCDLSYCTLETTQISETEVIKNLPYEPNKRRDLIRTLRINSIAMGNHDAANGLLSLELKASTQHHKNVYQNTQSYYNKYSREDRFRSFAKHIGLRLEDMAWGFGMSPIRLIAWMAMIIIVTGTIMAIDTRDNIILDALFFKHVWQGMKNSSLALLDLALISSATIEHHRAVFATLVATRTIILGLFVTVLYRRYAR